MSIPTIECLGGDTLRFTARLQDGVPDSISSSLISGSETLISSMAAISSGASGGIGYYYAPMAIPVADSWYVNQWVARFGVNTYTARQYVRADLRNA